MAIQGYPQMNVDLILSRLERVKVTGRDSWMACCSAHEDKNPSLSISVRNEKILLHCWAGCASLDVLQAIGLDFSDLFTDKDREVTNGKPIHRNRFPYADVLKALAFEATVVYISGQMVCSGKTLTPVERERLLLATTRIQAGVAAAGVA